MKEPTRNKVHKGEVINITLHIYMINLHMGLIIIYRYLFLNLRHGVLASSVVWLKMAGGIIQGILVDP